MTNVHTEKPLSYYMSNAEILNNATLRKKVRVATLSSFTVNGLSETIKVKCATNKIDCIVYNAPYGQYSQEIIDSGSALYAFEPDILFLIIHVREILSHLYFSPYSISSGERKDYANKQINQIIDLIRIFTQRSTGKLVVSNFCIPTYSSYGICENKVEYSLQEMIIDMNNKLTLAFMHEPSVYVYDFNGFVSKYGENNVFDYRQFHYGDIKVALDYIPFLSEDLMGYVKPLVGINRKCITLDLDNTLWGGIVGEDGFEGIKLGPHWPGNNYVEFQRHLLSLQQRGVILAINSKNNPEDALNVIRSHPYMILKEEHFANVTINWDDKVSNMQKIAKDLNIGLESIVYMDDDPINREMMCKSLPEILTIDLPKDPSLYTFTLRSINDFNVLTVTNDDVKRGEIYAQQNKRKELQKTTIDMNDFLSQLCIKIKIKNANKLTIPRIAQLIGKTNQFNLTTHRYQEQDIWRLSQDPKFLVGCANVVDKFGDNGITAVFIVRKETSSDWNIDTFLLSCRIMGRDIEDAIMAFILEKARNEGITKVKGRHVPTQKNAPCRDFLPKCGFKKQGNDWIYMTETPFKKPNHLELFTDYENEKVL